MYDSRIHYVEVTVVGKNFGKTEVHLFSSISTKEHNKGTMLAVFDKLRRNAITYNSIIYYSLSAHNVTKVRVVRKTVTETEYFSVHTQNNMCRYLENVQKEMERQSNRAAGAGIRWIDYTAIPDSFFESNTNYPLATTGDTKTAGNTYRSQNTTTYTGRVYDTVCIKRESEKPNKEYLQAMLDKVKALSANAGRLDTNKTAYTETAYGNYRT